MSGILALPEGCIAAVISSTTPRDACRLACVSTSFRSAADSDVVWDRFLPSDYLSAISDSDSSPKSSLLSKKELYLRACHNPLLINEGNLSFLLDKLSGKKCYMISAKALKIVWVDTPEYWEWISLPDARFPAVALLIDVCWFEIVGKINTSFMSPMTTYVAYLVFKSTHNSYGFHNNRVEATVGLVGSDGQTRTVYFHPNWQGIVPGDNHGLFPKTREDGWLETELGEFFYGASDEEGELSMTISEIHSGVWKRGLVVQGIEIRPKNGEFVSKFTEFLRDWYQALGEYRQLQLVKAPSTSQAMGINFREFLGDADQFYKQIRQEFFEMHCCSFHKKRYQVPLKNVSLPEGCLATVISFTTPCDAYRLACVSTSFGSAVNSDVVWYRFLPFDYLSVIFNSDSSPTSSLLSNKELYLRVCHNPLFINEEKMVYVVIDPVLFVLWENIFDKQPF
ncbi:hypothetical protein Ddye_019029 [Dipteronia dyeriana]|uniref:F-box domain-containing protein n=1 Tax=Dipteronia dyeriana TaxID=168575 RepID=A0AAD9TY40_9ROSI|nr:hypothetical protein Ddye_019029 [Dipteronia dyeriana]